MYNYVVDYTLLILNSGCEVLKSIRKALATRGTCTASAMSVIKTGDKIIYPVASYA